MSLKSTVLTTLLSGAALFSAFGQNGGDATMKLSNALQPKNGYRTAIEVMADNKHVMVNYVPAVGDTLHHKTATVMATDLDGNLVITPNEINSISQTDQTSGAYAGETILTTLTKLKRQSADDPLYKADETRLQKSASTGLPVVVGYDSNEISSLDEVGLSSVFTNIQDIEQGFSKPVQQQQQAPHPVKIKAPGRN